MIVERWPVLGGVCLNVGCIPSKALLHAAKVIEDAHAMAEHGIAFGAPTIDLAKLRAFKDGVIKKSTDGLAMMAKQRKVQVIHGEGRFYSANRLLVGTAQGRRTLSFDHAIIAVGSEPVRLPGLPPDDPRVIDSTGALALPDVPGRLLVVGGGVIGLEMATVYAALGSRVTVVELTDGLRAIIANVARYHRRGLPQQSHLPYMALDRTERVRVNKLASILRVANALDAEHSQKVKDLHITAADGAWLLEVDGIGDLAMERMKVEARADLFHDVFGRSLSWRGAGVQA